LLKADLHVHTEYSMDCNTPLEKIISRCQEIGINCISIADHDTIEGALKMQSIAPFPVIVSEEVLTPEGEIMGVFLKERVPSGLPVEQAISRIKAQGGLVCIPHPFDTLSRHALGGRMLEALAEQIDFVEIFNSRSIIRQPSIGVRLFADKYGVPVSAGSDAHTVGELGRAYVEMPEFNGRDDFLEALRKGRVLGRRTTPLIHCVSVWAKLKSKFQR
jgi:predicted metal-dependent phosphoesterase TrpH